MSQIEENVLILDGKSLSIDDVYNVATNPAIKVKLAESAVNDVIYANNIVKNLVSNNVVAYGVTTGFGSLSDVVIDKQSASQLSRNIILSHSVSVGDAMPIEWVRAAILVRINALIKGYSGVQLDSINALCFMLNNNLIPVIPKQGSLACSGDLCLLSNVMLCISKPLENEQNIPDIDVFYKYMHLKLSKAIELSGMKQVVLGPKEGLALTNGSTFTIAVLALKLYESFRLSKLSTISLGLALEAHLGNTDAYDGAFSVLRNNKTQYEISQLIKCFVSDSKLVNTSGKIQDSYSLRCAPQIHSTSCVDFANICDIVQNELNAATDNPLLVPTMNKETGEQTYSYEDFAKKISR